MWYLRKDLGIANAIGPGQVARYVRNAFLTSITPGGQPASNVATTRDSREVVKAVQEFQACQALQDAQVESGASYPAPGEAECGAAITRETMYVLPQPL